MFSFTFIEANPPKQPKKHRLSRQDKCFNCAPGAMGYLYYLLGSIVRAADTICTATANGGWRQRERWVARFSDLGALRVDHPQPYTVYTFCIQSAAARMTRGVKTLRPTITHKSIKLHEKFSGLPRLQSRARLRGSRVRVAMKKCLPLIRNTRVGRRATRLYLACIGRRQKTRQRNSGFLMGADCPKCVLVVRRIHSTPTVRSIHHMINCIHRNNFAWVCLFYVRFFYFHASRLYEVAH